jgi:uncharacterized protein (DUF302 family)
MMKLTVEQRIEILGKIQAELDCRYERLVQRSEALPFSNGKRVVSLIDVAEILYKNFGISVIDSLK